MAVLRNCCCCFSLRRGTVTLGVMGFTGSLTAIISLALGLYFVNEVTRMVIGLLSSTIDTVQATGTEHLPKEEQDKELEKLHEFLVNAYSSYIFVIAIVAMLISALVSGLMVWGAVKKRRMLLLPWLILGVVVILGTVSFAILVIVLAGFSLGLAVLIVTLIDLVLLVYFWLVVFSFYQELRERDRMEFNAPVEMKTRLTAGH